MKEFLGDYNVHITNWTWNESYLYQFYLLEFLLSSFTVILTNERFISIPTEMHSKLTGLCGEKSWSHFFTKLYFACQNHSEVLKHVFTKCGRPDTFELKDAFVFALHVPKWGFEEGSPVSNFSQISQFFLRARTEISQFWPNFTILTHGPCSSQF